MAWNKPVPVIEKVMKPFWAGLKSHRFLLMKCDECGAWYWPATYCRNHRNKPFFGSLSWTDASGHGKVISALILNLMFAKQVVVELVASARCGERNHRCLVVAAQWVGPERLAICLPHAVS